MLKEELKILLCSSFLYNFLSLCVLTAPQHTYVGQADAACHSDRLCCSPIENALPFVTPELNRVWLNVLAVAQVLLPL